jgi:hypothetical protein
MQNELLEQGRSLQTTNRLTSQSQRLCRWKSSAMFSKKDLGAVVFDSRTAPTVDQVCAFLANRRRRYTMPVKAVLSAARRTGVSLGWRRPGRLWYFGTLEIRHCPGFSNPRTVPQQSSTRSCWPSSSSSASLRLRPSDHRLPRRSATSLPHLAVPARLAGIDTGAGHTPPAAFCRREACLLSRSS